MGDMRLDGRKDLRIAALLIAAVTGALCVQPVTASGKDRLACAKVKRDIARVESRMRAGYTASQGRRLEERLRRLREKRYRLCR